MDVPDSHLQIEMMVVRDRLLKLHNGNALRAAAQLFGEAVAWAEDLKISRETLVDTMFLIFQERDEESLE